MSPRFVYPQWLHPVSEVLHRAELALQYPTQYKPVFACVSVPPQHGKSTLLQHWLAKLVCQFAYYRHAYCSYGARLAHPGSRVIRDMVERLGVGLNTRAREDWSRVEGGGIVACGIPGPITGRAVDGILLIDDPVRGRKDAESAVIRNGIWDWYSGDAFSRTHNTTSIIVVATRWHHDDLTGRLTSGRYGEPFELINIPVMDEAGNLLWPEHQGWDKINRARRQSEYDFWSLYMGAPRPRGKVVFRAPFTCARYELPTGPSRIVIGVDLAYTKSTRADRTAIVVMQKWPSDRHYYVTWADQWQEEPGETIVRLERLLKRYPGATLAFHGSTTEVGQAKMLNAKGLPIEPKLASSDKLIRSGTTQVAWNGVPHEDLPDHYESDGNIVVVAGDGRPEDAPEDWDHADGWFAQYTGVMQAFTGVGDTNDDYIDATTSAYLEHTEGGNGDIDVGGLSDSAGLENSI
ncbi:MAG: hypothetical protein ACPGVG_12065 [Mycobacterium sp.]